MAIRGRGRRGRDLTPLEEAREDLRVFAALREHYGQVAEHQNVEKIEVLQVEANAVAREIERLRDEAERAPSETARYITKVENQARLVELIRVDPRITGFARVHGRRRAVYKDSKLEKALKIRRKLRLLEAEIAAEEEAAERAEAGTIVDRGVLAEPRDDGWHWRPSSGGAYEGPFDSAYEALRDAGFSPDDARRAEGRS